MAEPGSAKTPRTVMRNVCVLKGKPPVWVGVLVRTRAAGSGVGLVYLLPQPVADDGVDSDAEVDLRAECLW